MRIRLRRRGEPHLRHLVDALPDAVVVVDRELRCVELNETAARLDGRTRSALLGSPFHDLGPPGSVDGERLTGVHEVLAGAPAVTLVYETAEGEDRRCYELRSHRGPVVAGRPTVLVVTRDVTEQHATSRLLTYRAGHDPLTGLVNRRGLMEALEQLVSRDPPAHFAVIMLDVDDLKRVNDSRGHAAGDDLLVGVARQLQSTVRESDVLARFGGDEFVVLAQRVSDQVSVDEGVRRLCAAVSELPTDDGRQISVSAGAVLVKGGTEPPLQPLELLRRADAAMYRAKSGAPSD